MKKFVKMKDERIEKESNQFMAKVFPWQLALLLILFGVKLAVHAPLEMCILDIICMTASIGYVIIALLVRGLLFHKAVDEQMKMYRDKILTNGYGILFGFLIGGELLLSLWFPDEILYILPYMIAWFFPALAITIVMLKKGWLIWGSEKRKEIGLAEFRKRVVIGSIFFGGFVGRDYLFIDGVFHASGFLWIIGLSAGWGIMFYFTMKGFIKISEKNADKLVKISNEDSVKDKSFTRLFVPAKSSAQSSDALKKQRINGD